MIEAGAYSEALVVAEAGVVIAGKHQIVPLVPYALSVLGTARRALLQLSAAVEVHQAALVANEVVTYQPFTEMIHGELCADYALAGEWVEAHRHARAALEVRRYQVRALGLTRWHETAALLAGGDVAMAHDDAAQLFDAGSNVDGEPPSLRFELVCACVRAALARYAGDIVGALSALEEAAGLADTLALPGERWQILVEVGQCAGTLGYEGRRQAVYSEAQQIIGSLAGAIDDPAMRATFLADARRLSTRAAHGPV